jgi:hypothetical protein
MRVSERPPQGAAGFLPQGIAMLAVVGAGGAASFLYQILVSRWWGPATLTRVLTVSSLAAEATTPAALALLPIILWAGGRAFQSIRGLQLGALGGGAVVGAALAAAGGLWALRPGELAPAELWVLSGFLAYAYTGWLFGRGAPLRGAAISALTQGLKVILVLPLGAGGGGGGGGALWAMGIAGVAGVPIGWLLCVSNPAERRPRPGPAAAAPVLSARTWAAALTSGTLSAWISADVPVAARALQHVPGGSSYGVVASLGKIPTYLLQPVWNAHVGRGAGWGRRLGIGATAFMALGSLAFGVVGPAAAAWLGVHLPHTWVLLVVYALGSTLLTGAYGLSALAARDGGHLWLLSAAALGVFVAAHPHTLRGLVAEYALLQAGVFAASWLIPGGVLRGRGAP